MMNSTDGEFWFEMLEGADAAYVSDTVSEVYAQTQGSHFLRVIADDEGSYRIVQLTNDRAELICGEARVSGVSEGVVARFVEVMLGVDR